MSGESLIGINCFSRGWPAEKAGPARSDALVDGSFADLVVTDVASAAELPHPPRATINGKRT
jgi:hypothetical protein